MTTKSKCCKSKKVLNVLVLMKLYEYGYKVFVVSRGNVLKGVYHSAGGFQEAPTIVAVSQILLVSGTW